MQKQTYFHLECGCENRFSGTYGPFEFVQLTYAELRIGPDGDPVAVLCDGPNEKGWRFLPTEAELLGTPSYPFGKPEGDELEQWYSDVVIHGSADAE